MIVVDTQILVYFTMGGPYADLVQTVRERDPEWVTVPLWRSEFRNVLAGYIRRGELNSAGAVSAIGRAVDALSMEIPPESERVLRLVTVSRCSAYDLEFVALAESLGVPFVTNDREVLDAFPRVAVTPAAFAG